MALLIGTALSLLVTLIAIVRATKRRPPLNFFMCSLGCVFALAGCLVTQTWMHASSFSSTGVGTILEYILIGVVIYTAALHGIFASERSLDATGSKILGILGFFPVLSLILAVPYRRRTEDADETEAEHDSTPAEDDSTPAEDEIEPPAAKPTMISTSRAAWIALGLFVYSLALRVVNDLPWLWH